MKTIIVVVLLAMPTLARADEAELFFPSLSATSALAGPLIGYELSSEDSFQGGRVFPELAGLAASGVLVTALVWMALPDRCQGEMCGLEALWLLAAALAAGLVAVPAAVTIAGDAAGGTGNFGSTFLGHLGGILGAAVLLPLG